MSNLSREMADIVNCAEKAGWRVIPGKGHWKVYAPDGKTKTTLSKTPGSQERIKAAKAYFRNRGVDC